MNSHPSQYPHSRRLHGGNRPHAKKLPPKSPHRNFVMSLLYTAKRYSKNYEYVIMKPKKVRWFQPENAPKTFDGRVPPGPAGGVYSAAQAPWLDLRSRGTDKGRRRERDGMGEEMRREEGVTREGQVGWEGRKGSQGEGGHEGRGEGEWKARNLAPMVISKSRRLC